jgi:CDP-glycerol glycerophosphotransferase
MNLFKFLKRLKYFLLRKIRNLIYASLSIIFKFLDTVFPKQKNLIAFTQKNNLFSDNSRAFFEHIIKNNIELVPIWFVGNKTQKEIFHKKFGYTNVKIISSIDGLITLLKAKTVVVSNSLHDFFPFFSPSTRKEAIQLWHGIKWTKKFEYPNYNFTKELTIICASSEEHKTLISLGNKISLDKIFITGLPRNDKFFSITKDNYFNNLPVTFKKDFLKKVILYAPTHRENLISIFFPFKDKNLEKFNNFLKDNNAIIYLRPHINDTNKATLEWKDYFDQINQSQIKSLTFDKFQDIHQLLPLLNSVITDYSAIYTDVMLLNMPMVFIPYDIEWYEKKRGLVYDYNEVTAGDKVLNQSDLIQSLKRIFDNENNHYKKLTKIKKKFHQFEDGLSSKRIVEILKSRLNLI